MEIKKASLLKVPDGHGLVLGFGATDKAGAAMSGDDKFKGLIHADLKRAWDRLKVHMALIPGLVPVTAVEDIAEPNMALFDKFFIHAFSIGGDEDKQGITLSGHWITYRNKAFNFHTPFELFEAAPEARYVYMDDCIAALTDLKREIELYLGGKRGEPAKPQPKEKDPNQTALFDEKGEAKRRTVVNVLPAEKGELNPGGAGMKLGEADLEAQKRVAAEFAAPAKAAGTKKAPPRARQTAANKSGQDGA